MTIANNDNLKINWVSYFISRPKESRIIENEILLLLTWIASSTITVRKGKGDKTRTIPLARAQEESLTIRLEVRKDYAREIKSDALFITRLGIRTSGESIC